MLLTPAKKKIATMIIASAKKPDYVRAPGEEDKSGYAVESPEADDYSMGLESAMEDLIAAIKDGNAAKAATAFENAFSVCESTEDEPEETEGGM